MASALGESTARIQPLPAQGGLITRGRLITVNLASRHSIGKQLLSSPQESTAVVTVKANKIHDEFMWWCDDILKSISRVTCMIRASNSLVILIKVRGTEARERL